MKKYFPILTSIAVLAGFLSVQIAMDLLDSSAKQTGEQKQRELKYEEIFKKDKFKTVDGKTFELSKLKTPIIVVNFWASWCQPCLSEFPSLINLRKKYNDDQLLILSINTDEEKQDKAIKQAIAEHGLNFPIVADKDYQWLNKFQVKALPFSVIYINGKLEQIVEGEKDFSAEELLQKFDKHIKKS